MNKKLMGTLLLTAGLLSTACFVGTTSAHAQVQAPLNTQVQPKEELKPVAFSEQQNWARFGFQLKLAVLITIEG